MIVQLWFAKGRATLDRSIQLIIMASTPPPIRLTRSASYLGPLVTGPAAAEIIASGRREVVTLSDRRLTLTLETRESAKSLVPMPLEGVDELERMLLEAFVDDDYDGRLRLLTATGPFDELLGLIFWRDVPSEEMRAWLHPALVDAKGCIAPPPPLQSPVAAAQPARLGHADVPPTSALATPGPNALAAAAAPPHLGAAGPPAPVVTAGSWTKIELLGTDRSVRGSSLAAPPSPGPSLEPARNLLATTNRRRPRAAPPRLQASRCRPKIPSLPSGPVGTMYSCGRALLRTTHPRGCSL